MRLRFIALLRFACLALSFVTSFPSSVALAQTTLSAGEEKLSIDRSHFSIKPPRGWRVRTEYRGKSMVFEDVSVGEAKAGKVHYLPNLTVALSHRSSPIDELEMDSLGKRLTKEFGNAPGVSAFQILESRFIDYRDKADGILVYTSFQYQGYPMNQMHVYLSGSRESVLLTYTQLEAAFGAEAKMEEVWNSMMSSELEGAAPQRYAGFVPMAVILATLSILLGLLKLCRRLHLKKMIARAERALEHDDTAEVWMPDSARLRDIAEATRLAQGDPPLSKVGNL